MAEAGAKEFERQVIRRSTVGLATLIIPLDALEHKESDGQISSSHEATLQVRGSLRSLLVDSDADSSTMSRGSLLGSGRNKQQVRPSVTGTIVDLTKLSSLVGVNEEDLIDEMHREAAVEHQNETQTSDGYTDEEEVPHEEKRLLPTINDDDEIDISLDADQFVDILDEAHHPFEDPISQAEHGDELIHNAFLIDVHDDSGEKDYNYVLALPEIQVPHNRKPARRPSIMASIIASHLPTDIKEIKLEATEVESEIETKKLHLDLVVKHQVPLIGYIILVAGLVGLSSVGAALEFQGGVSPTLQTFWRLQATALALFPFAAFSVHEEGLPKLTKTQWIMFPFAAFAYGCMTTSFVIALSMTSLANAFILTNLTSLVLIAFKVVTGAPVVFSEILGASIGFSGAAICAASATDEPEANESNDNEFLGNMIAISGSFALAIYLKAAQDLRANCNIYVFMFVIFALSSILLLFFMLLSGEDITFSMDYNIGIFGWMLPTADRLLIELYIVFACNFLGTMGYVAVLKYFDSVVVATVMLMEPVVATVIGYLAGFDPLPALQIWIGNAIVTLGCVIVIFSGRKKEEHIDATKAVQQTSTRALDSKQLRGSFQVRKSQQVHETFHLRKCQQMIRQSLRHSKHT